MVLKRISFALAVIGGFMIIIANFGNLPFLSPFYIGGGILVLQFMVLLALDIFKKPTDF
jgi:hypothetical protein